MKPAFLSDPSWKPLWSGLVAATVGLVLGLLALAGSAGYKTESRQEDLAQVQAVSEAKNSNESVVEKSRILRDYLPKYRAYIARGVIGDEQRLDWIEVLNDVASRRRLPDLQYALEPQHKLGTAPEGGPYELFETKMQLNMHIFHEGDAIEILTALEQKAKGLFRVQRCEFRRERATVELSGELTNLYGECRLSWITLKFPSVSPS